MNWLEFVLNNEAALGSFIGLGGLLGIVVFMLCYFASNIINSSSETE